MIKRNLYLDKIIAAKDKDYVKLLVGVRRSGKTTLLRLMRDHLLKNGISSKQMIEINFENIMFDDLKDGLKLHEYVKARINANQKTYLFFDEVQEIDYWARVLNSLRVSFNVDIYVTGSNARMFAGENLTYLAGRYLTIHVYPLSYQELIDFTGEENQYNQHYDTFLDSSFPSVVLEEYMDVKAQLKQDIYESIFERDIILRGKIAKERAFFSIARFVLEHIGSYLSVNNIYNAMKTNGVAISYDLVDQYINLMIKSYFLYECKRYDAKGREELKTLNKYYVIDFGIRNQLIPKFNSNRGRILENFVYLELIKQGFSVYVGKVGRDYEIDFVAKKGKDIIYIQVTESLLDPNVRIREENPFHYLKDNYKRLIVSLDTINYDSSNYKHYNVYDFIKALPTLV